MNRRTLIHIVLAIVPVILVSWLGNTATTPNIPGWYASLAKPWFTPPNWLFPVAWTLLFALMAWASFRILQTPDRTPGRAPALLAYGLQLAVNVLWSFAFFAERSPLLGLFVIIPFLALIVITIRRFQVVDVFAARLLWPYAAWVSYATLLNAAIWWLNR
jgi:tryptophan-rich sensory protein